MDDNIDLVDYSRQQNLMATEKMDDIVRGHDHIIIGCGGIGYWLAISLAMMGAQRFILVDGEKIDNSNLNRLPVPQGWLGSNKAVALRKLIRSLRPATIINVLTAHITDESLSIIPHMLDISMGSDSRKCVWDTTDNAIIQRKIYDLVEKLRATRRNNTRIKYRKIGYEAWKIGNYHKWDIWTDEDEYQTGYRTSSANAITSMLAAGIAIFAMGLGRENDFNLDLKELIQNGGNEDAVL